MAARSGKKVGSDLAARFFARFPELAGVQVAKRWPTGRYAVAGRVEIAGDKTLVEWRAKKLRKLSRKAGHPFGALAAATAKTIAAALDRWQRYRDGDDWLDIAIDGTTVAIRGALGQAAVERGAEELFGLFRMADRSSVRCTGRLTMFCPASSSGFSLRASDEWIDEYIGGGDVVAIDEAPELADEIDALLHARPAN
jgi:hypothetical protein